MGPRIIKNNLRPHFFSFNVHSRSTRWYTWADIVSHRHYKYQSLSDSVSLNPVFILMRICFSFLLVVHASPTLTSAPTHKDLSLFTSHVMISQYRVISPSFLNQINSHPHLNYSFVTFFQWHLTTKYLFIRIGFSLPITRYTISLLLRVHINLVWSLKKWTFLWKCVKENRHKWRYM